MYEQGFGPGADENVFKNRGSVLLHGPRYFKGTGRKLGEAVKLQAIVLNKVDYKESDRILTLFSPEKGRLTASARGVKKPASKLRAGTELFAFGTYVLNETRGRFTVTAFDCIHSFHELREEFDRLSAAALLLKLCERTAAENEPAPELFALLLRCLDKLRDAAYPPAMVLSVFLLRFCAIIGYMPQLDYCSRCGGEDNLFYLEPAAGGICCAACTAGEHTVITGGCLFYMRRILSGGVSDAFLLKPTAKQAKELYLAVCGYASYFFDGKLKIMDYLAKYDLL